VITRHKAFLSITLRFWPPLDDDLRTSQPFIPIYRNIRMSRFGSNSDEFLPLLKQYLAADAGEDYHDLEEVPRKLTEFAPSGHPYACRETVELLGTAVGNNSNSSYAEVPTK